MGRGAWGLAMDCNEVYLSLQNPQWGEVGKSEHEAQL